MALWKAQLNEWLNDGLMEGTIKWMNGLMNEWMMDLWKARWMNEWMNDGFMEDTIEWMNDWMSEGFMEGPIEWMNEWMMDLWKAR
jgi:hypothetical protein